MNISPHHLCPSCRKLARKEHAKYMKGYRIKTQKELNAKLSSLKSKNLLTTN